LRIVLFGITGFGNAALRTLRSCGAEVVGLVTRRETGEFPYYREVNISAEARHANIPVYDDLNLKSDRGVALLRSLNPEFLFVSSFHQKIPLPVIQIPSRAAINLHPSLLPAYRGATPPSWCLMRGEEKTGVTAHFLTEQMDQGAIIAQKEISVDASDTNGTLRFRLSQLIEDLLSDILGRVLRGEPLNGVDQEETRMSYHPKWTKKDGVIDFSESGAAICRRIRASLPYPGARAIIAGKELGIQKAWLLPDVHSDAAPGEVLERSLNLMAVATGKGVVQMIVDPTPVALSAVAGA
jgi:methionyl-tRNA formyltransferase